MGEQSHIAENLEIENAYRYEILVLKNHKSVVALERMILN